jgi:hypothetical protein
MAVSYTVGACLRITQNPDERVHADNKEKRRILEGWDGMATKTIGLPTPGT